MNKTERSDKLVNELYEVSNEYDSYVDKYLEDADKKYHTETGYSLRAKIEETYKNSEFKETLSPKMDDDKTLTKLMYSMKSYERYKTNNPGNDFEKRQWNEPYASRENITKNNIAYTLNTTSTISDKLESNIERSKHKHKVQSISDLKFGDVIQLYQPYEDERLKRNTKNSIDSRGQNRYYGIVQGLPNGDYLAVNFYGHRNPSPDALSLKYDSSYPYPASKYVSPTLDIGSKNLIQIPREAIMKGTLLKEKHDSASYGKKYDKFTTKVEVLEMSPENKQKFQTYRNMMNKNQLDIGWSKDKNEVVAASSTGERMFNQNHYQVAKYLLKTGVYEKRNIMLNVRLERQQKIREKKFDKKPIKIQSNYQKEFLSKEHSANKKNSHFER